MICVSLKVQVFLWDRLHLKLFFLSLTFITNCDSNTNRLYFWHFTHITMSQEEKTIEEKIEKKKNRKREEIR